MKTFLQVAAFLGVTVVFASSLPAAAAPPEIPTPPEGRFTPVEPVPSISANPLIGRGSDWVPTADSFVQGFKCSPGSGRCRCSGKPDCDYMKDLIKNSCGKITCTGSGSSQQCTCTINGY